MSLEEVTLFIHVMSYHIVDISSLCKIYHVSSHHHRLCKNWLCKQYVEEKNCYFVFIYYTTPRNVRSHQEKAEPLLKKVSLVTSHHSRRTQAFLHTPIIFQYQCQGVRNCTLWYDNVSVWWWVGCKYVYMHMTWLNDVMMNDDDIENDVFNVSDKRINWSQVIGKFIEKTMYRQVYLVSIPTHC